MATTEELISDPRWLPHQFDAGRGALAFAQISREGLAREAFLDDRMRGSVTDAASAALDDLKSRITPRQRPAFIFHTAFCCSTLMARALDHPGASLALKEPNVLMDLANAYRVAGDKGAQAETVILDLLARPHIGNERVLIKPTNTANNLVDHLPRYGSRAVLLYGDLRGFLVSVIKKGEACRAFVRKQYNIFALDPVGVGSIPQRQALGFTDLQIAAFVWRHQMELFTRALQSDTPDRLRSLDFRKLLSAPAATLSAAADHLDLAIPSNAIHAAASGPIFKTDSKFQDQSYDAAARGKDEAAIAAQWDAELSAIEGWAMGLKLATDISPDLPKPLV